MTDTQPNAPKVFHKKPVTIEAVQFTGDEDNAARIIEWAAEQDVDIRWYGPAGGGPSEKLPPFLLVMTLEGNMRADVGDWIIRGLAGEFYPCKPDIFNRSYATGPAPEPVTLPDGTAVNALLLAMRNCGDHAETISTALIVDPQETVASLLTRLYGLDTPNPYGYPNDPRDSRVELRLAVTDWPLPRPAEQQPADVAECPF